MKIEIRHIKVEKGRMKKYVTDKYKVITYYPLKRIIK